MTWDATKSSGDLVLSSDWNDMVNDQKNHNTRHESGGSDEIALDGLNTSDDSNITFGNAPDAEVGFDSTNDRLEIRDSGVPEDLMHLPTDGTSNIKLPNRNLDLGTNNITNVGTYKGVTPDVDIGGQTSVTAASSDELLIEDASDSAAKKKVTAQSIADLGSGGVWSEDGNSPATASGSGSVSITLNSTYDSVIAIVECLDNSGTGSEVQFQVNGITSANYDYYSVDGSQTTGSSAPRLYFISANGNFRGTMFLNGQWDPDDSLNPGFKQFTTGARTASADSISVDSGGTGGTLNSIKFLRGGGESSDWRLRVFGKEV